MAEQIRAVAMNTYRFFAVNEFDRVTSLRFIDCTDDADANVLAASFTTEESGVEVWDVGRCVSKIAPINKRAG